MDRRYKQAQISDTQHSKTKESMKVYKDKDEYLRCENSLGREKIFHLILIQQSHINSRWLKTFWVDWNSCSLKIIA